MNKSQRSQTRCPKCGSKIFCVVVLPHKKTAICTNDACLSTWAVSHRIIKKAIGGKRKKKKKKLHSCPRCGSDKKVILLSEVIQSVICDNCQFTWEVK